MILDAKETTIAYRCPHCGNGVISMVGVFALSGDMIKLKCDCGKSELTLQHTKDGNVRISTPCIICPNSHNYTLSSKLFFSNELFRLSCTYTGIDICFIGSKDAVLEALKQNEEQLTGMLEEAGVNSLDRLHEGSDRDLIDDPAIEEIIRFMLAELNDEGKIHCGCHDGDVPEYVFEFAPPDYDEVRIYCKSCGKEVLIPMTSVSNANAFLHCDELFLK